MNPGTLVCGGLSVLLGVVVWLQRSAANKDAESAAAEILRASNDWSTAVLKLDEQSRLAFTLQTQLKILQEAHLAVTNELPTVKGALSLLNSNHAALNLAAQQASNQSRLMLLELIDEKRDALNRASQAAAAEGVAWRSALVFSNQAVAASGQMLELSNQFALVEQERRSLAAELS
ncbi:MAG: hypothetical protein FJ405_08045, partial [Verrucomicrobia bacterium]|nr:hypothetical protein [Verrucomicrobiota bacterium]